MPVFAHLLKTCKFRHVPNNTNNKTPERRHEILNLNMADLTAKNTSIADYVWLPIVFENDVPKIYWHDEWKIEDFV